MSADNEHNKNKKPAHQVDDEDDQGGRGTGDQSGRIAFRDFLATGADLRDDLLPFDELKRLLSTHKDLNESKVKQQKEKRDQYKALKEGKVLLKNFRDGLKAAASSLYKINPILANKAQFSGVDKQVSTLPTENLADTNEDQRNELENELKYRLGNQFTPTFSPKPRGPGY